MIGKNLVAPIASAVCAMALLAIFWYAEAAEGVMKEQELIVPPISEIRKNGYPVNESGNTYGGDFPENIKGGPDLILAENQDGLLGYIRSSDIDGHLIDTPEKAVHYEPKGYYVDMYLQDGQTKIGTYYVTKPDTP